MMWPYGATNEPNRQQNILVGTCKHLYLTRDGRFRRQQKAIDPRLPGTKTLLTRLLAMDVSTNVFYAELHPAQPEPDIGPFLARAWSIKPDHAMRGVPATVNIGKAIRGSRSMLERLLTLQEGLRFAIDELPSGFPAGAAQVKLFDRKVEGALFVYEGGETLDISSIQSGSAVLSDSACAMANWWAGDAWAGVAGPSDHDTHVLDVALAGVPWRDGPWRLVLEGIPKSH